jgi:alginate O-acetyltransferase complex protein AlgJ
MATLNARRLCVTAVVLFFAALWTPLIGMFFGVGEFAASDENRRPAVLPKLPRNGLRWLDLGGPFTAYLHDRFGFRGTMIAAQALFKVRLLGVSSSPEVLIGKHGWLFYTGEKSMDSYRGVLPLDAHDLAAWVQLFTRRQDWLARRGILMIVVIVPDKQTVYPEFLPSSIRKSNQRMRLDTFLTSLRSASTVPLLDLRPALIDAKTRYPILYSASDTHWNARGAYVGYVEVMREIARKYPDVQPLPLSRTQHAIHYASGDLAKMLGLGSVWREELDEPLSPPTLRGSQTPAGDLVMWQAGAAERRLVIFGDSFGAPLVPYLAPHFAETVFSQSTGFKPALIAESNPDVVLFEFVERKLNNAPPPDPSELMDGMDRQDRE